MEYEESTVNVCQLISSRSAARKNLPPLVQPTRGEITSFIYHFLPLFFQQIPGWGAISQERNPPCVCVRALLQFLFVSIPIEPPSLSGKTTQILFLPNRNISQYLGIYGPLILAGQRLVCWECVFPVALHKAHMHLKAGGRRTCHADTQVFRLHYNSN